MFALVGANSMGSSFSFMWVSPHPQRLSPEIRVEFDPLQKSVRPNFRGEGSEDYGASLLVAVLIS